MATIIGFELANSTTDIPPSTWAHDGVLEEILEHVNASGDVLAGEGRCGATGPDQADGS